MIGFLKGRVQEHQEGRMLVVMAIGEGSIGYVVSVPNSPNYGMIHPGVAIELHIHTVVREDALDLYGFSSAAEKELFLTLLTVNGIGPKGALGILSKVEPATLIEAVLANDKVTLQQIPGIGKKTAERVVIELADPLQKKVAAGKFSDFRGAGATAGSRTSGAVGPQSGDTVLFQDAKDALIGLGYREQDVVVLLKKVLVERKSERRVEDVIRTALQQLN